MGLRTNVLVNNFSSGELAPELLGRVDLAKYQNGCETMVNWLPMIEGGMMRRPGTRFASSAKFTDRTARLVPFIFSTLQTYILEFGDLYVRFYKDRGQIVDPDTGAPIELGTPYPINDVGRLKFKQDADTLYIAHAGYATYKLTRTSHTAWTLIPVDFQEGPFLDQNGDDASRIVASGGELIVNGVFTTDTTGWSNQSVGTGTLTVAAGQAVLTNGAAPGDVGALMQNFTTVPGFVYVVAFDVITNSIKSKIGTTPGGQDLEALSTETVGSKTSTFTATTTQAWLYFESAAAGTTCRLDNVSCNKPMHTGAQVTLTATSDIFLPGHVGAIWKLADGTGSPRENPWVTGTATGLIGHRYVYNGNVYEQTSSGTFGTRPPVHLRGNQTDGIVSWTFINQGYGYVEIISVASPRVATAIVQQHLPLNVQGPYTPSEPLGTSYWAPGVFSSAQGYPRAIAFIEQRLALAGTINNPSRIDLSETGNYEGFKQSTLADSAVSLVVASGEVNNILWMEKGAVWFVGTNGCVYALFTSNDTPIAPDNLPNVKEVFSYGSADLQPLKIGGNLLFLQRGGKRVREINYEAGVTNDVRSDRTILARHITDNQRTITAWSYEQDPNSTVFAVRSDGTLLALTYFPEQDVFAWSRHTTQGTFESVATIPTATSDQTWVIVNRTINGETVRYVEYFDETVNTDCALTYQGPPAISSLSAASIAHLLGKEVQIKAHDGKLTPVTIADEDLTLMGGPYSFVEVGLQYDSEAVTVRPEIKTSQGSLQGILARNPKVTARVVQTPTIRLNEQDYPTRSPRDYMNTGPPYVTGDIDVMKLGHTTTKQVRIQQTEPYQAKVIGLFVTYDAGEP